MTKIEKAEMIVRHHAWDGIKSARELANRYSTEELDDMIDVIHCIDCEMDWE